MSGGGAGPAGFPCLMFGGGRGRGSQVWRGGGLMSGGLGPVGAVQ